METTKKRVLIAEDNPGLAHVMSFNLKNVGLDVTVANSGTEAWQHLQHEHVDIFVTDQEMPGMTGLELCSRMRRLEQFEETPIVMVTARELELDIKQLTNQLGVAAVFAKPYSPHEVVQTVTDLLTSCA